MLCAAAVHGRGRVPRVDTALRHPASLATLLIVAVSFRFGAIADLPFDPQRPLAPFANATTGVLSSVQDRLEGSARLH